MKALARCVVVCALFGAACDQAGTTTELTRPTTAPVKLVTFSGTLQMTATDYHTFGVTQDGYVEVTLLGLGAPAATTVTMGIGAPTGTGACTVTHSVTTAAGPAAQIVGTGLAGTLCVSLTDAGTLTAPAIYTITVATS